MLSILLSATFVSAQLVYPETPKGDVVETLHGVKVADPYRWLEDGNSAATKNWVKAQNAVTQAYLNSIPERKVLAKRLETLWNYERFSRPERAGKNYFYSRNNGLQNQSVVYVTQDLAKPGRVLLDPNKLSKDGTVALNGVSYSEDGKLAAYAISVGGSDWLEWRVRDVETGKDLPDVIRWSKFSGASWTKGGRGFYYSAYSAPKKGQALQQANYNQRLYYHRLGTPQSQDQVIYQRPDHKSWGFDGTETEDGRYLVITQWDGTERETRVFVKDLRMKNSKVQDLLVKNDARYQYLANNGSKFYFLTDNGAPKNRVVEVDLRNPRPGRWRSVIKESKLSLESVSVVGDSLFASYLRDAVTEVKQYDFSGKLKRNLKLPGVGTTTLGGGRRSDKEAFFSFTSYAVPAAIYRLNLASGATQVFRKPNVKFAQGNYETKQVFYASKDGTKVPMFLTYRKGIKLDGTNPTLLTAYGGFNVSITPYFSPVIAQWLELGGVYAEACIRGGGEYGKAWHDAGRLKNKQNCYDDFIAAGEYLIRENYTSTPKLAIEGASNGGLLIGAVLNQRPDLWGAALPEVGVMDLLRFHKFTIGWGWKSDFGDPDKKEDFEYIFKISPLHNIRPNYSYPPVLVTTGDHDDRVVPAHSFKYISALQAAQVGPNPVLIRIETSAGHGAGKPTQKIIEEIADQYSFLIRNLGISLTGR
ncbi:MAG: prolyl oligopeptidase family serine peptidase [Fimbriimonas sp.]